MNATEQRRAFEVFDQLRSRSRAQQDAALIALDGSDALREAVRTLLSHDGPTETFLGSPVSEAAASLASVVIDDAPPIGLENFRVLRRIGEGSFGTVYLAEQLRPRRLVALKLMSKRVPASEIRRFQFEADALARLDHPSVTSVLEVGRIEERPFIVMEYIDGVPIDRFADMNGLGQIERLRLLCAVCEGVEHSHRRGVIHRDLAPKNILVTAEGVPKILDFGLACETDAKRSDAQHGTLAGSVVGTLRYASPEQLAGVRESVGVRSDVYALGIVAYELLERAHPYLAGSPTLTDAVAQLGTAPVRFPTAGPCRSSSDYRAVLLKAVEREPAARYPGAMELGHDLAHLADNRPVSARPAGPLYRARKLVARHRTISAAVLLGLIVVVAASANSLFTLRREAESRQSAISALEVVIKRLVSPLAPRIGTLVERDRLLSDIEPDIIALADRSPSDIRATRLLADFLVAKGDVQRELGENQPAERAFEGAIATLERCWELTRHDPLTGHALSLAIVKRGDQRLRADDRLEARSLFIRALELDRSLTQRHPTDVRMLSNLFWSYIRLSEFPGQSASEADAMVEAAAQTADQLSRIAPEDWHTLEALATMDHKQFMRHGKSEQSAAALRRAVATAERLVAAEPDSTVHNATLLLALVRLLNMPPNLLGNEEHSRLVARAEQLEQMFGGNLGQGRTELEALAYFNSLRAHWALESGRPAEAIEFIERALVHARERYAGVYGRPRDALNITGLIVLRARAEQQSNAAWSSAEARKQLQTLKDDFQSRFAGTTDFDAAMLDIQATESQLDDLDRSPDFPSSQSRIPSKAPGTNR